METITREVDQMQAEERSAAELLIGRSLRGHERIVLNVLEMTLGDDRPAQSIDDWMHVYDGLSDAEVEEIDAIIKTRANLTREVV